MKKKDENKRKIFIIEKIKKRASTSPCATCT